MNKHEQIAELLTEIIDEKFDSEPLDIEGLDWSDNLAEMLEKLVILHIRTWKLEDKIGAVSTNDEIAELKKKIDFCFKIKRPQLIRAINSYLNTYITEKRSLLEENIKIYNDKLK